MLPIVNKPPITRGQKRLAIAVAGAADLLQIVVFPLFGEGLISPLEDVLDFLTAVVLIGVCGFKWQFVVAFLLELVPFVDIFPTWTALVLTLPSHSGVTGEPGAEASRVNVSARVYDDHEHAGDSGRGEPDEVEGVVVPPVQAPPVQG